MNLLESLSTLGRLDRLPRTGWLLRGVEPCESIAGHVVAVAQLAAVVAPREPIALDLGQVLTMALLHDAPEACSGDLPSPASRHLPEGAKRAMEAGLARELLEPMGAEAHAAWEEFQAQESAEARFVKLCDRVQLGLRLLEYVRAGWRGLEEFEGGLRSLDCGEFTALAELHAAVLAALEAERASE